MSELQKNYKLIMNGWWVDSHEWKSIWMNFIHHTIMFDVNICDSPNLKMLPYVTTLCLTSKLILLEYCIII
jgi:hypothetical protein